MEIEQKTLKYTHRNMKRKTKRENGNENKRAGTNNTNNQHVGMEK